MNSIDNKEKIIVSVRGGFSDNNNFGNINHALQTSEFDARTRTVISNSIRDLLEELFDGELSYKVEFTHDDFPGHYFCKSILSNVLLQQLNLREGYTYNWRAVYDHEIFGVMMNSPYNEVLDIIWYIADWLTSNIKNIRDNIYKILNNIFESECVGYRFVNGQIIAITDTCEIKEIEEACNCDIEGAKKHIQNAVALLSNREHKDYKNCIKESISAVESICKVIVGKDNATLGEALNILESKRGLKGQLKSGFEKLYKYTNDKGGIRHADGLFVSDVTFEEAKFMLVSCSAFVNYLIAEYIKIVSN